MKMTLEIKVEAIISAVQEHFDNENSYMTECKKKEWWRRNQPEKDSVTWHERNRKGSEYSVWHICNIFNIDMSKLYTIARMARKWEEKNDWQKCFPAEEHAEQIMKYIVKTDTFPNTEIGYINWKINEKNAKKVA